MRAGDSIAVTLDWRATEKLPGGSYLVAVRVDRDMPADFSAPAWLENRRASCTRSRTGTCTGSAATTCP
ncbi:MAG: hypothetical protein IPJ04_02050 [Candidatus Eisenbacteria bacterium]|nr:hypothetical protein [Candidatus Eisenbacteria bacterium]